MLPELLDQIPPDQEIGGVTADGAYDTRKCHDAIGASGRLSSLFQMGIPHLADRLVGWALPRVQDSGKPTNNLHEAGTDGRIYLDGKRQGIPFSPYTYARLNPLPALGVAAAAAAVGYLLFTRLDGDGYGRQGFSPCRIEA